MSSASVSPKIAQILKLRAEGMIYKHIAGIMGCSAPYVYKVCRDKGRNLTGPKPKKCWECGKLMRCRSKLHICSPCLWAMRLEIFTESCVPVIREIESMREAGETWETISFKFCPDNSYGYGRKYYDNLIRKRQRILSNLQRFETPHAPTN